MNPRSIEVNGIRTRYFDDGSGIPVALFHGGQCGSATLGSSARIWEPTIASLAPAFRTIALDRPGQGFMDQPPTDADYTLDNDVRHGVALLTQIGDGPYHLVGHGSGGYVVCRIALEYPQLVRTCTIVDSSTLAPGPGRRDILADAPQPLLTRESQRWVLEAQSFNLAVVTDEWIDEAVAVSGTDSHRAAFCKMVDDGLEHTVFGLALARGRDDTYRRLIQDGMPVPTFVIWGLNDPTSPLENGKLLIELLMRRQRQTEVRVINKAGHFVFRDQPASFNEALFSYLKHMTEVGR
jgi:2-hydroxy-6-oxonona-2,4-dienedioate hydrolase